MKDNLDGPPPSPHKIRDCFKHFWRWSGYTYDNKDIYKCKRCGKTKVI